MSVNMFKHPGVRIDVMVEKEHWPKIVSIIQNNGGSYFKEDTSEIKGKTYILIRDVKTVHAYSLFKLIEELSTYAEGPLGDLNAKIYILIKPRKKAKKNVQKDREEAGTGSEGGNGGESGADQSGEDPGTGGSGTEPADIGNFSPVQLEIDLDFPEINTDSNDQ